MEGREGKERRGGMREESGGEKVEEIDGDMIG